MSTPQEIRLLNVAIALLSSTSSEPFRLKVSDDVKREALLFVIARAHSLLRDLAPSLRQVAPERAAKTQARDRRRAAISVRMKTSRREAEHSARFGRAVKSLFETFKVGGVPVGTIRYSELQHYRRTGELEATVCDLLIKHGTPSSPDLRVDEFVSESTLEKIIKRATGAASKGAA